MAITGICDACHRPFNESPCSLAHARRWEELEQNFARILAQHPGGETSPRPDRQRLIDLLVGFNWSNYGLDNMEETASDDWAEDLATAILQELD